MHFLRQLTRSPSLLLFVGMLAIVALALFAFGSVHLGNSSGKMLGIPGLWLTSLIALPIVAYVLLVMIWRRFDRIAR